MDGENHLPVLLTSFVGREAEMVALDSLLSDCRLVTITGPGGVGKTRLAIEAARLHATRSAKEIVFCDLGRVTEGSMAVFAIGAALNVHEGAGVSLLDAIVRTIGDRDVLLMFDNAEHVAAEVAEVAATIVRGAPNATALATSRSPLGVSGEAVWKLNALSVGPEEAAGWAGDDSSVQLFVQRVEKAAAGYQWDEARRQAAARICRRLDGAPLAIEIAAAKVAAVSITDLELLIERDLAFLHSTAPAELRRQETLAATMEWSLQMLPPQEAGLFRRLSVFLGGATLEQVAAVCQEGVTLVGAAEILASLVEKSMAVMRETAGDAARYALLEPLRDLAFAELLARGEADSAHERHRAYYVRFVEARSSAMRGSGQVRAVRELSADADNIRAAISSALNDAADVEAAATLIASMGLFWRVKGRFEEAARWTNAVLTLLPGSSPWRGRLLASAGSTQSAMGNQKRAIEFLEQAVAAEREQGNGPLLAEALCWLGQAYERDHDASSAMASAEEAEKFVDPDDPWIQALRLRVLAHSEKVRSGVMSECVEQLHLKELKLCNLAGDSLFTANVMNCLGEFARHRGEFTAASAIYRDSLDRRAAVGDQGGMVLGLTNLGLLSVQVGRNEDALSYLSEALELAERIGSSLQHSPVIVGLAGVAANLREFGPAARFLGMASAFNPDEVFDPPDETVRLGALRKTNAALGAEYGSLERAGRLLGPTAAISEARAVIARMRARPPGADPYAGAKFGLSRRESEILDLVASGLSNKEIAERLVLSVRTIETHVANVYAKLDVSNRSEATAKAIAMRPAAQVT